MTFDLYVWTSSTDEQPARVVAVRLPPSHPREALDSIIGLATKYDLVQFDPDGARIRFPLQVRADFAAASSSSSGCSSP